MRVAEINTAIIATTAPQYLPEFRKVERIKADFRYTPDNKKSSSKFSEHDSIEISSESKVIAEQSKSETSRYITDSFYHSDISRVYKENFDETLFNNIPNHLRESVSGKNWKAEKHVKEVRGGFIVSGTNGSDYSAEEDSHENRILEKYENESVRLPGHLLSVLM
jgi:hypothetical protein